MMNLTTKWWATLVVGVASLMPCASRAVVGYYNLNVPGPYGFIANQLQTPNQTLNGLVATANASIPDGALFLKWNAATSQFFEPSVFMADIVSWSENYSLGAGEGGIIQLPAGSSPLTLTFVGEVLIYTNTLGISDPFLRSSQLWEPNYANGMHLLSSPVPISGGLDFMFYNVTGRDPLDGERVGMAGNDGTVSSIATFSAGMWDNNLTLQVGQSAWFDLGGTGISGGAFPMVPEPSSVSFLLLAAGAGLLARRQR